MKTVLLIAMCMSTLFAHEGKILFEKHCTSCHTPFIPMTTLKENFLDEDNTLLKLKAPTLNQISYRLKQRIGDPKGDEEIHRMEVSAFISEYVFHPSKDKSVCLEDVIKHFKTMPSLQGKVSPNELDKISTYVYDFDAKIVKEKSVKQEGYTKALLRAKKEHKLIILEAMSKTCHFCRKMEREVLIDTEVVRAIKKDFILVSIDVSSSKLPLGLEAKLTPSFIFIDANEKVLMHVPGAWGKDDFLLLLKEANQHRDKRKKHESK